MVDTRQFIVFCLSWCILVLNVSSKPTVKDYPQSSYNFARPRNINSLGGGRQVVHKVNSIKVNQKPTHEATLLAFGTTPFSNAALQRISRRSADKSRYGRTDEVLPLPRRTTGGNVNSSQDALLNRITAVHFLKKYNYISHHSTGNHNIKTAIKTFQRFMHLPVNGYLDKATMNAMKRKRCGIPDVEIDDSDDRLKRFAISKKKWNTTSLLYAFEAYTTDMSVSTQKAIIAKAFKIWADAGGMVFTATNNLSKAHIKIMFGSMRHGTCNTPFDGSGEILAHAFFPRDGRLHFDDDEFFTDGVYTGTNLLSVAVHEIGHTLGLAHSTDINSIMFPNSPGYVPNLTLGKEDINAIKYLYAGGTSSPGRGVSVCQDTMPSCASQVGFCKKYPNYMNKTCQKTCKFCLKAVVTDGN